MLEQELRQRDDRLGPTHPDTLLSVTCLAMLLQAQGELGGAKPLYERALRGFEEKYGPTHRDTLISVNNLAVLLKAMGELGEARPLYERVLAGDEEQLGPKHPHTLDSVYNLARLYQAESRLEEAVPLFEREVRRCAPPRRGSRCRSHGSSHATTLFWDPAAPCLAPASRPCPAPGS